MQNGLEHASHLGRLHVALVLASGAMLVALSQPEPSQIEEAKRSIRAIVNVVSPDRWSALWTELGSAADARVAATRLPDAPSGLLPTCIKVQVPGKGGVRFNLEDVAWEYAWASQRRSVRSDQQHRTYGPPPPTTLTEFREFWDQASEDGQLRVVAGLENTVAVAAQSQIAALNRPHHLPWSNSCVSIDEEQSYTLTYSTACSVQFLSTPSNVVRPRGSGYTTGFCIDERVGARQDLQAVLRVVQRMVPVSFHAQSFLARGIAPSQVGGSFAYAFPALDAVSAKYQALSLARVEELVAGEAQRSPDAVEISGLRINRRYLGTLGTLIVWALQIVFALHLAEFVRLMAAGERDLAAPWIGLFPGWPSRFAVLASIVFPAVAVCTAYWWTRTGQESNILSTWLLTANVGSPLVALLTVRTMIHLWRKKRGGEAGR